MGKAWGGWFRVSEFRVFRVGDGTLFMPILGSLAQVSVGEPLSRYLATCPVPERKQRLAFAIVQG